MGIIKTKAAKLEAALRDIGHPAHFGEIAARTNTLFFSGSVGCTQRNTAALLQRVKDIFARTGQGTYGLVEWGLKNNPFIRVAITKLLKESEMPLPYEVIRDKVLEKCFCKVASIHMYLNLCRDFKKFPDGTYGLSSW